MRRALEELEALRGSRAVVLAASNLDLDLLPALYDALRGIGRAERLDLLILCRGGVVNAARRVALLLHHFAGHLAFIVPDRCESAGTIAALAAHEIVAGPAAIFSPIDPLLETPSAPGESPSAISAQDVRLFGRMAQDWFGLAAAEAGTRAMTVLCESIFPTTLTAFHRATLEVEAIAAELLALARPGAPAAAIVEQLLHGHHSHGFALTPDDLRRIGLPVRDDPAVADRAWEIVRPLREGLGAGARRTAEADWFDAIVATTAGSVRRRRSLAAPGPVWEAGDVG